MNIITKMEPTGFYGLFLIKKKSSDKMNAKQGPRSYVDFDPSFEWSHGEETNILRVYLPGFEREHIKVQVDGYGNLRTTGERPLEDNQWSRFRKDFHIPANCSVNSIRDKFEDETLIITLPKEIVQVKPTAPNQLPPPSKPPMAPPKLAPAPEVPKPVVSESKPAADQPSVPSTTNGPTKAKLGAMLSSKKEDKVDDNAKVTAVPPVTDKKKTEKEEEKPVEEKRTEKQPITESDRADVDASTPKELAQPSRVMTGLRNQRQGLLLNVTAVLIVLLGMMLYFSFRLRKVADGDDHHHSHEML